MSVSSRYLRTNGSDARSEQHPLFLGGGVVGVKAARQSPEVLARMKQIDDLGTGLPILSVYRRQELRNTAREPINLSLSCRAPQ
jgi:hypothetical protein